MCPKLADSDKISRFLDVGSALSTSFFMERDASMIKKGKALKGIFDSADAYQAILNRKNVLFLYCPRGDVESIETRFISNNFKHLTGVKGPLKPNEFYKKALSRRLSVNDIGTLMSTTELKLKVLPNLINNMTNKAMMICENPSGGYKVCTELLVGTIIASMGFVKDKASSFFVPNTVLDGDTRQWGKFFQIKMVCIKDCKDAKYTISLTHKSFSYSDLPLPIQSKIKI